MSKRGKIVSAWDSKETERKDPIAAADPPAVKKRDGRSLRATGRTEQLNIRTKAETRERIMEIAEREGITMAEVVERAIEKYS